MEENFKKVEAKYKFYEKWKDITGNEQEITVDLIINYHNKTFSVTPNNQSSGKFTFCQGGASSSLMWYAILAGITNATEFARKELEFID